MGKKRKNKVIQVMVTILLFMSTGCSYRNQELERNDQGLSLNANEENVEEMRSEENATAEAIVVTTEAQGNDNLCEEESLNAEDTTSAVGEGAGEYIESDTSAQTGIEFTQFDTEFYRVEDVAIDYCKFENIKDYQDLKYDLDGDGQIDVITMKNCGMDRNGDAVCKLYLDGEEFFQFYDPGEAVYLVDVDKKDNSIELITFDEGPSDDPTYRLFAKEGSEMVELSGDIVGLIDQNGKLIADTCNAGAYIGVYEFYYEFEDNMLKVCDLDLSGIKDVLYYCEYGLFTTDMKSVEEYFNNGYDFEKAGIIYLSKDDKFNFIGFENDLDIKIQLQDGTIGYLLGMARFAG